MTSYSKNTYNGSKSSIAICSSSIVLLLPCNPKLENSSWLILWTADYFYMGFVSISCNPILFLAHIFTSYTCFIWFPLPFFSFYKINDLVCLPMVLQEASQMGLAAHRHFWPESIVLHMLQLPNHNPNSNHLHKILTIFSVWQTHFH